MPCDAPVITATFCSVPMASSCPFEGNEAGGFVAALDEGSLAGAGRKLGRSPAAVSRAVAFLEAHVGAELLHRTTRSIKLSEAGERYAAACRRMLTELEEADILAAGEGSAPRGTLTLTAPVTSGEEVFRPILDAFLDAYPTISAKL